MSYLDINMGFRGGGGAGVKLTPPTLSVFKYPSRDRVKRVKTKDVSNF